MNKKRSWIWIRIIIIQVLFVLLHYLYDWFPNNLTALFSGINESVYQHMKIGFFAYVIYAIGEFFIARRSIRSFDQHLFSRLFSAWLFPFAIMVIFLAGPLMFGRIKSVVFEVIFANIALLLASLTTLIIESHVEEVKPTMLFRIVVISLFVLSLVEYTLFTNRLPWFDIFAIPPGY